MAAHFKIIGNRIAFLRCQKNFDLMNRMSFLNGVSSTVASLTVKFLTESPQPRVSSTELPKPRVSSTEFS